MGRSIHIAVPTGALNCTGVPAPKAKVYLPVPLQSIADVRPFSMFGMVQCGITSLMNYGYIPPSINAIHEVQVLQSIANKATLRGFFVGRQLC